MSFFDQQFPPEISFGARGGPQESTNIVVIGSGAESRRARWSDAGGGWNSLRNNINISKPKMGHLSEFSISSDINCWIVSFF